MAEKVARFGLLARGEERLEGTRRDVEEAGGQAVTVRTDVSDADQVDAAADEVEDDIPTPTDRYRRKETHER